MACKDGECFLVHRAILHRTSPGQIVHKLDRDTLSARSLMRKVFRRFLAIHEFVLGGVPKINYFRSRRVRWSIREVQDNLFSFRIISPKFGCMHQIFGKVLSPSDFVILGGPAGGSALERASPPRVRVSYDT